MTVIPPGCQRCGSRCVQQIVIPGRGRHSRRVEQTESDARPTFAGREAPRCRRYAHALCDPRLIRSGGKTEVCADAAVTRRAVQLLHAHSISRHIPLHARLRQSGRRTTARLPRLSRVRPGPRPAPAPNIARGRDARRIDAGTKKCLTPLGLRRKIAPPNSAALRTSLTWSLRR